MQFPFFLFFLISNRKNAQSVAFAMYVEEKDIEYVFVPLSNLSFGLFFRKKSY